MDTFIQYISLIDIKIVTYKGLGRDQSYQARAILNFSVNAKESVNRKIKKWGRCRGQDYLKV